MGRNRRPGMLTEVHAGQGNSKLQDWRGVVRLVEVRRKKMLRKLEFE